MISAATWARLRSVGGGIVASWPFFNHYGTLLIASIASLLLIAAICLLIAFMQFQIRLLSSLPSMTSGQLLAFVDAERQSLDAMDQLRQSRKELSRIEEITHGILLSSRHEVDVFCSIFKSSSPIKEVADARMQTCIDYMKNIPFDETANGLDLWKEFSGTIIVSTNYSQKYPLDAEDEKEIDSIIMNLLAYLNIPDHHFGVGKISSAQRERLSTIAMLNKEMNTRLRSIYTNVVNSYNSNCQVYQSLQQSMPYRRISNQGCQRAYTPDYWTVTRTQAAQISLVGAGISTLPSALGQPLDAVDTAASTASGMTAAQSGNPGDHHKSFELVSNYIFYSALDSLFTTEKSTFMEKLILSPGDFIALWLVMMCGMLGGFINILFLNHRIGKDPTFKNIFIDPIQGIVCALVVYILLRSGFMAIADADRFKDVSTISPFFLAFVGVGAGLVASMAIDTFRNRVVHWLCGMKEGGDKWGFGLKTAVASTATNPATLAGLVNATPVAVQEWLDEKIPVPRQFQALLAVALKTPERLLFTVTPPP